MASRKLTQTAYDYRYVRGQQAHQDGDAIIFTDINAIVQIMEVRAVASFLCTLTNIN